MWLMERYGWRYRGEGWLIKRLGGCKDGMHEGFGDGIDVVDGTDIIIMVLI